VIPPTPLGIAVIAASIGALRFYAFGSMDLVLLVFGYGALGLAALSLLVVVGTAIALRLGLRLATSDDRRIAETGRFHATGASVPRLLFVPLVQTSIEWEEPEGVTVELRPRAGRLEEHVRIDGRIEIERVQRRVVVQDPFGLCRVAFRRTSPLALEVRPHAGALHTLPTAISLSAGEEQPHPLGLEDGDRVELRRYVPGDPARFIHWKVFGRTRRLMIRMPERALTIARRTAAYVIGGESDEASAAAAMVAVHRRAFGDDWVLGADGFGGDARTLDDAARAIVRSATARESGATGLEAFVARAEREGPAAVVLFVPARESAWVARAIAVARKRPGRVRAVVGVDGLDARPATSLARRVLFADPPFAGTDASALESTYRTLAQGGIPVTIVDRTTGRAISAGGAAEARRRKGRAA
jgi:uncharacterized protein (DUF58 family)